MGLIVDSSVLIAKERAGGGLDDLLSLFNDEPIALAAITASEILAGVYRSEPSDRRLRRQAYVEEVLTRIAVLPFDLSLARVYARIAAHLASIGQLIATHDLLIAATALAHDYAVLTDNARDFHRVPGLTVRQPDW